VSPDPSRAPGWRPWTILLSGLLALFAWVTFLRFSRGLGATTREQWRSAMDRSVTARFLPLLACLLLCLTACSDRPDSDAEPARDAQAPAASGLRRRGQCEGSGTRCPPRHRSGGRACQGPSDGR